MKKISKTIQQADWKSEKHVPVIECGQEVVKDEMFDVKVGLGKEIAHPNTTEHHIRWISLYFKPDDMEKVFQVGHYAFSAHGEAVSGPNEGPVYTHHQITTSMKITSPGTIYALALCNIHGLWESSLDLKLK